MSIEPHIDPRPFERDVTRFAAATGRAVSDVLHAGGKDVVRTAVKLTAPTAGFNPSESFASQRRAGMDAIEREIPSAYVELEELSVLERPRNPDLADSLSQSIREGDTEAVRAILDNAGIVQVPANKMLPQVDERHHQSLRNRRGKIPPQRRNHPFFVMKARSLRKLIRLRQRNVGTGKAGWVAAALALGVRLPAWITRHRKHGRFRDDSRRTNNPSITLTNTVDYVSKQDDERRFLRYALRNWSAKVARQLEAKMRGQWGRK